MKALIIAAVTVLSGVALAEFSATNLKANKMECGAPVAPIDFHYAVGHRFFATVTPEKLHDATSIYDLIPEDANWEQFNIYATSISVYQQNHVNATNNSITLNDEQKSVFSTLSYQDQIVLKASSWTKKDGSKREYDHDLVYYISIVPNIEARYIDGHEELMRFLKEGSKETIKNAENWKLKPGKLSFTVSTKGEPKNAKLLNSCGYPEVDSTMTALILTTKEKWLSALDANNQPVEQELFISFGQAGC